MTEDFEEYIRQGEPSRIEKSRIWKTAIGLQQVDGLTPSAYLIENAKENIEGKISIEEVRFRIESYYEQQSGHLTAEEDRTEEADKVSANMAKILSENAFTFSPTELLSIHKRLFTGVAPFSSSVGAFRDYNISKKEWVLNNQSVVYSSAETIPATLEYDFGQEKEFRYNGLSKREVVAHIAAFISGIWQIHAFGEGNTRTIAVFTIKYLRMFGFEVDNDPFAKHSWYFRNALVRANYNDYQKNVYATPEFLMKFFGNLLLGEQHELKNRHLRLDAKEILNSEGDAEKSVVKEGGQKITFGGQKRWSEKTISVLELIKANPSITRKELSDILKINPSAIQKHLEKLKHEGAVSREGSDKKGIWKVKL